MGVVRSHKNPGNTIEMKFVMERLSFEDIRKLVSEDEGRTLEFKRTTGELDNGMKSACAFLNTDGGWLLFGINPDLKIIGQNVSDSTKQEIAKFIRLIEPVVDIPVQYIEVPEKPDFYVIAMYLKPPSPTSAPYTYDGRPYYKIENITVKMPRGLFDERVRLSNPSLFSWERRKDVRIGFDDIDSDKVFIALHKGVDKGRIPGAALAITTLNEALLNLGLLD